MRSVWDLPTGSLNGGGDFWSPSQRGKSRTGIRELSAPWQPRQPAVLIATSPGAEREASGCASWVQVLVSISLGIIFASSRALSKHQRQEWITGRVGTLLRKGALISVFLFQDPSRTGDSSLALRRLPV